MRRRIAQLLAAATGVVILLLAVLFAVVQLRREAGPESAALPVSAPAPAAQPAPGGSVIEDAVSAPPEPEAGRGRRVYRDRGCAACHSIAGSGNRRSPLDGVGARLSPDAIRRWIVDPRSMDPSVRKPAYKDLAAEDLEAMVAYLATLVDP